MKIIHREFLPVQTKTVHAATVEFFNDTPYFSWFGGAREGDTSSSIYLYTPSKDLKIMGNKDLVPRWNPILFNYEDRLHLFVKAGEFCDRWQTYVYDLSEWDDFDPHYNQILPAGLNGPVKTRPIVIKDDFVLCGSSVETMWDWTSYMEKYWVRKDHNPTWDFVDRSNPITVDKQYYFHPSGKKVRTQGIIQPSLWEDKDGTVHAFMRSSYGLGKIYHSHCTHLIENDWSKAEPTEFDNPNSGVDTVYHNDSLYLVHNPSISNRKPLVVSKLDDEFNEVDRLVVESEVRIEDRTYSYELSYPYMIENKGLLHLVYTYGRSRIEYVTISM